MVTTKEDLLKAIDAFCADVEQLVAGTPARKWETGVYENGWNARQVLCHIASTAGIAGFVITLARTPVPAGPAGDAAFDNEAFNTQQVAARKDKPIENILNEIRDTMNRDRQVVEAAPDQLLASMFRAPWGTEGTVAGVIGASFKEHLGTHLAELKAAIS
jgi:hypothetical protein